MSQNLCIVNLQRTGLDKECAVRIFGKCDDVMIALMKKLKIAIPKWTLNRFIFIDFGPKKKKNQILIAGVDADGTPFDYLSKIELNANNKIYKKESKCLDGALFKISKMQKIKKFDLTLSFMQNYNEPSLSLSVNEYLKNDGDDDENERFILNLSFCPYQCQWSVRRDDEIMKNLKKQIEEFRTQK